MIVKCSNKNNILKKLSRLPISANTGVLTSKSEYHQEMPPSYTADKKVKKKAKIRNRYNQVPHLTRDTIWESDKNTRKHHT